MDQNNQTPEGGTAGGAAPDGSGSRSGDGSGPGGAGSVAGAAPRAALSGPDGAEGGREGEDPDAGDRGGDAAGTDQRPAGERGAAPSRENNTWKKGRTAYEITRALNEADGDRALAARVLGITTEQLSVRINENAQLKALWGKGGENNADGPPVPRQGETLNRNGAGLPVSSPGQIELLEMVTSAERELHNLGLKKLGVSQKVLDRLKGLEGLASSTGHFIAQSLEVTARSYYVQILEMMEMAHDLRAKLMIQPGVEGYIANDETRAFFNKNYIEFVKEAGRAFELMLQAAQAMVKMMLDSKSLESPDGGGSRKPKWTQINSGGKSGAQDRPKDI